MCVEVGVGVNLPRLHRFELTEGQNRAANAYNSRALRQTLLGRNQQQNDRKFITKGRARQHKRSASEA